MIPFDENYCLKTFERLLTADSTTGQYAEVQALLCTMLDELGYSYHVTHKGGVIADLGGEGNALCVTAHLDDIGLMVRHVNADGTLNVCPVGGLYPFYCVTENVRVYTRTGRVLTGTVCRTPNSVHVTEEELRTDSATAGGWTIEKFGAFPHVGDTVSDQGVHVKVLSMDEDGLRVEKILAEKETKS